MQWLYTSILAYILLGIGNLGDKLVVTKYLSSPKIYAISVALLQSIVVLLLPFFWQWPGVINLLLNFATGVTFVVAIYFLYSALKTGETSGVVPAIDALSPIVILIISFVFLAGSLDSKQILAVLLLVGGGILLAWSSAKQNGQAILYIILAAICFAISQTLADIIYNNQEFLSAFAWSRLGAVLVVVPFLMNKKIRQELKSNFSGQEKGSNSQAVAVAQIAGGVGFFLQNYAIKLGNVGIVAALQGVKYLFLFILIAVLGKKFVQLKENWNGVLLARKIGGVVLVLGGLVVLVL